MLDIQAEQHDHGQPYQELYEAVGELKRRHDLHPCAVHPRDGLALRGDAERERVQDLVSRFRKLPEDTRRRLPALLNSLAQLEIVIGDLDASLEDFQEVTRIVTDPISLAEAHHNVYRAALERREFDTALADLRRAVALDAETFEPFPFAQYEPQGILGVGGFGVSFLCRELAEDRDVVVKSIRTDAMERDADALFGDFATIKEIDHPALIRIHDMGRRADDGAFPYLVQEYYPDAQTLSEFIAQNGAMSAEQWMEIGWPIGRALQALHNRGVLHRSLRPSCVLIRKKKTAEGRNRLQVRMLDAAMSLKRAAIHASASNPDSHFHTSMGRSVARLLAFQPPEVVGRPKGQVWIGPHSDLYSFGRLCACGLTGRPDPDNADRLLLPEPWQKMLAECLSWTIDKRPVHAGPVLDALAHLPDGDTLVARIERDLFEETVAELTVLLDADPEDLAARINRANAYYRQGEFAKAILDFGKALERRPDDASLYKRRAQAHSRLQDVDKTIGDYTEALRREPRDLEALANRGLAYAQKGEHEKAIADYTEGLRHAPRDEAMFYNRGNAHSALNHYDRALEDYNEALRTNPKHLWALGNRGKVHALRGEPGKALTDFNRLIQLDPGNFRALCDRAATLLDLGHVERAIVDYTEAIRLAPSAGLFHDRGLAHLRNRDPKAAVADLGEALNLSPNNASLLMARADALAAADQSDEALADLEQAIRLAPKSSQALIQRADLLGKLGRHVEAVTDLTEAIRLSPAAPAAYFARGVAHATLTDHDRANADFTEVIRLDPQAYSAWANRGTSHAHLGEMELALADYDRALEIAPNDPLALLARAGLHVRLGNVEPALADYAAVLRRDPASGAAHAGRGLLLASKGDLDEALADLNAAIRLRPGNARIHNHRGHVRAERGERLPALADFREAVRLDARDALAWFNLAVSLAEGGEHLEAAEAFGKAIELEPGNAAALNGRGNARRALGDEVEAILDYSAALSADAGFVAARYNRAALLAKRGEAKALADLDEVLRGDPHDLRALLARGRVHGQMGRFDLALADNQQALSIAPDDPRVWNNLAWLWATAPNAELRDPQLAIEFARRACSARETPANLDTLASALASAGLYEEAASVQQKALDAADEDEKAEYAARLEMYRAGRAYVQAVG